MGYDVFIAKNASSERAQITEAEWRRAIEEDNSLILNTPEVVNSKGEVIRYEGELVASWREHPEMNQVWFDYRRGKIGVTQPDRVVIAKMKELASKLDASVVGEEGEVY